MSKKTTIPAASTVHDDEFLTSEEVAEWLNMSKPGLSHWRADGIGPPYLKAGRWIRYRRSAVARWIAEQEAASCQ